ncbi:proline-rich protein 15 [Rhinatrema bivittatum]|uniref:proline-rich protein 15 n=1 Tax=Rhinatrema bivittatum TaxID=194408 RepID=UPI001126E2B4|nr:proline-rich protein 15 [Rhinatrema bivittatum]XP_029445060.1 proline-rich protein 15 [Rhinatrema bivittatum]XP_029445061.1 proline-rich protein 15 [Rhinatrema bivittatum]
MAESAAEKSSNQAWWKALTVRKKPKEAPAAAAAAGTGPGQDTEHAAAPARSFPGAGTASSRENQHPNSLSDFGGGEPGGGGEPRHERGGFTDKSCRRNLKISRSGRFKEKRKLRAALPENPKFFEGNTANANEERQ